MSVSVAFQDLVLSLLAADSAVVAIVADRIVDGADKDLAFPNITLGSSDFERIDAECIPGREETLQLDCWTRDQGRLWPCRQLVDAVVGALHEKEGQMATGALVSLNVTLVRSFIDPDNITGHGVVQVTAEIEE